LESMIGGAGTTTSDYKLRCRTYGELDMAAKRTSQSNH
jgi:hypothetical protein